VVAGSGAVPFNRRRFGAPGAEPRAPRRKET
jgi:hypothetical protein